MEQYGLLHRLRAQFTGEKIKPPCIALAKASYERQLGITDLLVVYVIMICGLILASSILFMEILSHRRFKALVSQYVD